VREATANAEEVISKFYSELAVEAAKRAMKQELETNPLFALFRDLMEGHRLLMPGNGEPLKHTKEQLKTAQMKKVEENRHNALVVCWKRTEMDSFFLQIDEDEGHYGSAAQIQTNNSMMAELGSKAELGKWYRIEYSRYINSNTHVLVHEIMAAKKRKKSYRTRVEDDQVQVG
jgi:hypothetical protein